MRQLIFVKPGLLEWQEVPAPRLETPEDAIVRPVAVTTCDGDLLMLRGELPSAGPFAFGHEFVAEIVDFGQAVHDLDRGQLAVVPVEISCGRCDRCRRGQTAFCKTIGAPAAWGLGAFGGNWPGAFSDLLRVPFARHMLVPVPDGVPAQLVASAGDNLSDAWRTVVPHLLESPGARVLVVGRASIGLYAVAIAFAAAASQVDYLALIRHYRTG